MENKFKVGDEVKSKEEFEIMSIDTDSGRVKVMDWIGTVAECDQDELELVKQNQLAKSDSKQKEQEFKIGDKIMGINELHNSKGGGYDSGFDGGIIIEFCCDAVWYRKEGQHDNWFSRSHIEEGNIGLFEQHNKNREGKKEKMKTRELKAGKELPSKESSKYIVCGGVCDNLSQLLYSEKELKEEMKGRVNDSDWTGRIIGYELVPIYEVKTSVWVTKLKSVKKQPAKKKRKNSNKGKKID